MKCSHCGSRMEAGKFCSGCGKPLEATSKEVIASPPEVSRSSPERPAPPDSSVGDSKTGGVMMGLLMGGLAAFGFSLFLALVIVIVAFIAILFFDGPLVIILGGAFLLWLGLTITAGISEGVDGYKSGAEVGRKLPGALAQMLEEKRKSRANR